jgi:hypothetical protein
MPEKFKLGRYPVVGSRHGYLIRQRNATGGATDTPHGLKPSFVTRLARRLKPCPPPSAIQATTIMKTDTPPA